MQYILTQEEYDKLLQSAKKHAVAHTKELQEFCTWVADNAPIKMSWSRGDEPRPWLCVLTHDNHYCDECPAKKLCPNQFKEWSK